MSSILNFTGTLLKNLVSKPITKNYPEEPAVYPERTRGRIVIDIDQCISCGLCVRNCPPRCITVDKNEGTWTINRFDCIACGYCASKCPKKCLKLIPGYQKPGRSKAAVTYRKSEEVMEAERQKAAEMAARKAAALLRRQKRQCPRRQSARHLRTQLLRQPCRKRNSEVTEICVWQCREGSCPWENGRPWWILAETECRPGPVL